MHRALAPLALLCWPLLLSGCQPENEVDNPRLFVVEAVHHGPNGRSDYRDSTASFRCLRYACEADPALEDAKWAGESAEPPPESGERCRCVGTYVLEGPGGLALGFSGLDALAPGTHLTSEDGDLAVFYRGERGVGAVHVSRLTQLALAFGTDYTYDIAGGFEVQVGPHRFVSGFFYSTLPEHE
ncbi:MAG: hypothetical protein H6704_07435 [Myxococcales bacterium]|nr:hypothetical protein [Myxococcales bacterium]MCB9536083.1 hypothetical protein [Myxococcales bacterium]